MMGIIRMATDQRMKTVEEAMNLAGITNMVRLWVKKTIIQ